MLTLTQHSDTNAAPPDSSRPPNVQPARTQCTSLMCTRTPGRHVPFSTHAPTLFLPTHVLKPAHQAGLWALNAFGRTGDIQELAYTVSNLWLAAVFLAAAAGFLLYGGRLFVMLQRFPIESRGRRKKLREVGLVTSICAGCFTFRCAWWRRGGLRGGHGRVAWVPRRVMLASFPRRG